MLKKITVMLFSVCTLIFLLAACQADDNRHGSSDMLSGPIDVKFSTDPAEGIKANEPVELQLHISQMGDPVINADEARFEIWYEDNGQEESEDHGDEHTGHGSSDESDSHGDHGDHSDHTDHNNHSSNDMYDTGNEFVDAEEIGDGIYTITYTFDQTGTYYIKYHVTGQGYHSMRTNEIHVE
ncbi:hypothetical protein [Bacillus horti]|uniref:YtkA-like domain-containing protein n=1 Tax=Caldalkalibacillus horti TaxID=77523 RepID=A0ABT9W1F6_9BACI|nr:hypothetical protein [Bacillus horti]MDQ0167073.1 hypothetical protein [Bacillus horti]